ncbi:MAG: 2OG-Fe(II) oxygenase superfamily protein [Fibrobacteria bacterium]|nr:2OG-Fe(II) oxygenase superfamily protein [Fibrobacteria bacterium]
MTRNASPSSSQIADHVALRLEREGDALARAWNASLPVRHLVLDDLLPPDWASAIASAFPAPERLRKYDSLKERKSIGVDMDAYDPVLKDVTFALQSPRVLRAVEKITGIRQLNPDANLYSSGLSSMEEGDFLNPHIDNSGNPLLGQYRRINALYYVTPGWEAARGGNLELWDARRENPVRIEPRFNRLVLMNTNRTSYHSVNPIRGANGRTRNCVSNYYFSPESPEGFDYFHVTSFRGRPEQPVRDAWLRFDAWARGVYRAFRPRKPEDVKHRYTGK